MRSAGIEVPDPHAVLQQVAGGMDQSTGIAIGVSAGVTGTVAVAAAAAAIV